MGGLVARNLARFGNFFWIAFRVISKCKSEFDRPLAPHRNTQRSPIPEFHLKVCTDWNARCGKLQFAFGNHQLCGPRSLNPVFRTIWNDLGTVNDFKMPTGIWQTTFPAPQHPERSNSWISSESVYGLERAMWQTPICILKPSTFWTPQPKPCFSGGFSDDWGLNLNQLTFTRLNLLVLSTQPTGSLSLFLLLIILRIIENPIPHPKLSKTVSTGGWTGDLRVKGSGVVTVPTCVHDVLPVPKCVHPWPLGWRQASQVTVPKSLVVNSMITDIPTVRILSLISRPNETPQNVLTAYFFSIFFEIARPDATLIFKVVWLYVPL